MRLSTVKRKPTYIFPGFNQLRDEEDEVGSILSIIYVCVCDLYKQRVMYIGITISAYES